MTFFVSITRDLYILGTFASIFSRFILALYCNDLQQFGSKQNVQVLAKPRSFKKQKPNCQKQQRFTLNKAITTEPILYRNQSPAVIIQFIVFHRELTGIYNAIVSQCFSAVTQAIH